MLIQNHITTGQGSGGSAGQGAPVPLSTLSGRLRQLVLPSCANTTLLNKKLEKDVSTGTIPADEPI